MTTMSMTMTMTMLTRSKSRFCAPNAQFIPFELVTRMVKESGNFHVMLLTSKLLKQECEEDLTRGKAQRVACRKARPRVRYVHTFMRRSSHSNGRSSRVVMRFRAETPLQAARRFARARFKHLGGDRTVVRFNDEYDDSYVFEITKVQVPLRVWFSRSYDGSHWLQKSAEWIYKARRLG